ncbi:hypothetical protein LTR53_018811, partial [Teratosphaeriaceae sp. CCFEE 6253]
RKKDILKESGALNFGGKAGSGGEAGDGGQGVAGGMRIVKREVVRVECEFDDAEREFYQRLQDRADRRLLEMQRSGGNDYIGALVLLLRLRQVCNHSRLIEMAVSKDAETVNAQQGIGGSQRGGGDDMDDLTRLMGGVSVEVRHCDVCQVKLEKRDQGARCGECEADLAMMKRSRGKKEKK